MSVLFKENRQNRNKVSYAILVGILTFISIKISHGIQNFLIENKFLEKFNSERMKHDLILVDTSIHKIETPFKHYKDYFGMVKMNYSIKIKPKDQQNSIFLDKSIIIQDKNIFKEIDRYKFLHKAIHISYNYCTKEKKYTMYEYNDTINGQVVSREEIRLNSENCLDTLKKWTAFNKK